MTATPEQPRSQEINYWRRMVIGLVLAGAFVLLWLLGAAVIPRWWAQRIGDQVQGSMTSGILIGLAYGFVFTILPLVLLWLSFRFFESWKVRAGAFGAAIVLAAPNLMTLGISLGSGNGAHAGDRILDVEGPGFRWATLVGALVSFAVFVWIWSLRVSRRRALQRARRAEAPPAEEGEA